MSEIIDQFKEQEYSAQLFGFTPNAFVDAIYNGFSECIQEMLIEFHSDFKKVVSNNVDLDFSRNEFTHSLAEIMAKYLDKLEVFLLDNTMCVSDHILLPEDEVHRNNATRSDVQQKAKDIEKLKMKIFETIRLKKLLLEEAAELKQAIELAESSKIHSLKELTELTVSVQEEALKQQKFIQENISSDVNSSQPIDIDVENDILNLTQYS
ncbi:hypothetical protein HELRODRAFT_190530 [Helobdella robusta]|uniref:Protein MIS12 homolog n=1 Tax=Helobdella robusta TaxID=6412 RepID=T1FS28_HELRO|nr:hypothetical protein HELRODRAFT_190530 [Helobdella robusta]ESO09511.1 hypothetical protein HELRODRAFT_190530 [Helobdella robusta]